MSTEADPSPPSRSTTADAPPHGDRAVGRMTISAEQLVRQVYDKVEDFAILTLDPQAVITSWNVGARKIFGYDEGEALGASMCITFPPEDLVTGQPFKGNAGGGAERAGGRLPLACAQGCNRVLGRWRGHRHPR